jgi:hypothetical protein
VLLPYFTPQFELSGPGAAAHSVLTNPHGDFAWAAGSALGETYRVFVRPHDATRFVAGMSAGPAPSPLHLEFPGASEAGADIAAHAREALLRARLPLPSALSRLRAYFQATYRYAHPSSGQKLADSLGEFMDENRVGDCRHLASAAALLLRASGIPTRMVTGFVGAERDGADLHHTVYGSAAHAWVEIMTEAGWMPVDPTAWIFPERGRPAGARAPPEEEWEPSDSALPIPREIPRVLLVALAAAAAVVFLLQSWRRARKTADPPEEEEAEIPSSAPPETPGFVPRTRAEHLLVDYGRLQEDLADSGQERRPYETPREHAQRLATVETERANRAFDSLVPLVDDGLYGQIELTPVDLEAGRDAIREIRRDLT